MFKKGYVMSDEHKKNISESRRKRKEKLGYLNSPETREKIRLAHLGKKQSPEVIEKRFKNTRGENHWQIKLRGEKPNCKNCGKMLSSRTHQKHFLCKPCWARLMNSGTNSSSYKGGYENRLMTNRKRRILRIGSGGSHTLGEWEHIKALYHWTCPACLKKEPEIKLTEDHIVPLKKGGTDDIENIQPLCGSCNSRKQAKIIRYRVKEE